MWFIHFPVVVHNPPPPPGGNVAEVELLEEDGYKGEFLPAGDIGECDDSYVGIGVTGIPTVASVAPGGPADKAGIQVDDLWIGGDMPAANLYPIGKVLHLIMMRGDKRIEFNIAVGRVCVK